MTNKNDTAQAYFASVVQRVIAVHFDENSGSPYWLDRQRSLGLDARRDIKTPEDLALLGPMDESALASRPIEDFIPRSVLPFRREFVVGETAGTLGRPKSAVHRGDEFEAAFVAPFVAAATRLGFPREVNWLFIGPSGPHIIGKAARRCAQAMDSCDPFAVDLDPRWAKKLSAGSFAAQRYLQHVQAQAMAVIETQNVGVIFSTPAVLDGLAGQISPERRQRIRGLHLGGLPVGSAQRVAYQQQFPNAVILSGYGNTLFGVMPELRFSPENGIDYYPHGRRLMVQVVAHDADPAPARLGRRLPYGQRGQVVIHRLDETQFIPNMMERDTAILLPPDSAAAESGFCQDGLRDPQPIVNQTLKPAFGLY